MMDRSARFLVACGPVCLVLLCGVALAQSSIPEYSKLRTPAAPGFVLLGVEPSSVERPSNPTDLAFSVLSRTDQLNAVPENFALEISPYWLFSHPDLTFETYAHPGLEESLLHTATLSVATAALDSSATGGATTSLAVGLRFSILRGRASASAMIYKDELVRLLQPANTALGLKVAEEIGKDPSLAQNTERLDERKRAILSELAAEYCDTAALAAVRRQLAAALQDRRGLMIEMALAGRWDFTDATWEQGELSRWGVWLTPALIFQQGGLVGVARYLGDRIHGDGNVVDLGARLILFKDRYAFSLESVGRFFTEKGAPADQHRLAFAADYRVSEATWLTMTFGRDFHAAGANSLIAVANLSFGFGERRELNEVSLLTPAR